MHRAPVHPRTERQPASPRPHGPADVYGPWLRVMIWVMRATLYMRYGRRPEPQLQNYGVPRTHNRQLRRAKISCLRRARRFAMTHRRAPNPENYMPRAYAHFSFAMSMPEDISPGQCIERFAYASGLGRIVVHGLSRAHHITRLVPAAAGSSYNSGHMSGGLAVLAGLPLGLAVQSDPAPP